MNQWILKFLIILLIYMKISIDEQWYGIWVTSTKG